MNHTQRISALEEKLDNIIDKYNTVSAQNIAMNHALGGLFQVLPSEIRETVEKHYDLRCAIFQVVLNNGQTELDALSIQREEIVKTKNRIFRDPPS